MKPRQRDFEDLLQTAEIKDFFFRAEREMFPKLQDSAISLSIFTGQVDAKLAMEFGAAISVRQADHFRCIGWCEDTREATEVRGLHR